MSEEAWIKRLLIQASSDIEKPFLFFNLAALKPPNPQNKLDMCQKDTDAPAQCFE